MSKKIGELYTVLLKDIEELATEQHLQSDDLRVKFSKGILLNLLNLVNNLQKSSNWKSQMITVFKNISKAQKKIITFLKFKYPRNKKNFLPTDLIEIFQEMNDSEHTDYDLIINSKVFFDFEAIKDYERTEVISKIKKLLNAMINETNRFSDTFRSQM